MRKLIVLFILLNTVFAQGFAARMGASQKREILKHLTDVEGYFYARTYKQASRATDLRLAFESGLNGRQFGTELNSFVKDIRANRYFTTSAKAHVLSRYKRVLKIMNIKTPIVVKAKTARKIATVRNFVEARPKRIRRNKFKKKKVIKTTPKKVIQLRPLVAKVVKPVSAVKVKALNKVVKATKLNTTQTSASVDIYKYVSFALMAGLLLMIGFFTRKYQGLRAAMYKTKTQVKRAPGYDDQLISTMIKMSSRITPSNHYVIYDFHGKVTECSANLKDLLGEDIKVGSDWNKVFESSFYEVEKNSKSFFVNVNNTAKYFLKNSNSIKSLQMNLCQLTEVDKEVLMDVKEFSFEKHLESPFSVVDVIENSLAGVVSFKDSNLLDNVNIAFEGVDTCFQKESIVTELFATTARLLGEVNEISNTSIDVMVKTLNEKHIISIDLDQHGFSADTGEGENTQFQKIEQMRSQVSLLGGSIIVKNVKFEGESKAVVQMIFKQMPKRRIRVQGSNLMRQELS